jgi:glycosyltransferase involved in cell wall biosynthesis
MPVGPPRLSILVPVFNERPHVAEVVRRVLAAPLPDGMQREVVIVDDGSTDGTQTVLSRLQAQHPEIVYLPQPCNRGKGRALQVAIAAARGEYCIFQDADLEYDPNDYPRLLGPLLQGRAEAVYGSRFRRGGGKRQMLGLWHTLVNRALTFLVNLFARLNLTDMETCYKAFRLHTLRAIPLCSRGFDIEAELTLKLARRRARICEVPIAYQGRTYAEGKKIGWRDGVQTLALLARHAVAA